MTESVLGPGSILATRFRLEDLLVEHDGARFWRASDLVLARSVAVHVLSADDPRTSAVRQAARSSATINDQHFLRVLDALEVDGHLAVVHEWGSGLSLDLILAEGLLPARRAAWLTREVAEALTVAHRRGLAHGRLIPENVLVTEAGSVRIIGFAVDAALHDVPPTDASDPAGSERAVAQDVRDLGALLYATQVGRWPGSPGSAMEGAPSENGVALRPRKVRAGVSKELDLLCQRLLGDRTDARPNGKSQGTAADVARELTAFLGEAPSGAMPGGLDELRDDVGPMPAPIDADLESTQAWAPLLGSTVGSLAADPPQPTPPHPPGDLDDPDATQAGSLAALRESESPRATTAGLTEARSAGFANGLIPSHWGPDPLVDTGELASPADPPRAGLTWLKWAAGVAVLALLVLGLAVGYDLFLTEEKAATPPAPRPSAAPIRLAEVSDFDPAQAGGGPSSENPGQVPFATDAKPKTAWHTLVYQDGPELAPYKPGVGLLLDLGREQDVSTVALLLTGGPYTVQLLAAPTGSAPPTSTRGLEVVAERAEVSSRVSLTPESAVRARYFVVWLTSLPVARDGDGYQGGIAELSVRS